MYKRSVTHTAYVGCAVMAAGAVSVGMISMPTNRCEANATPAQTRFVQLQAVTSSIALGGNQSEWDHTGSLVEAEVEIASPQTVDLLASRPVTMAANAATDAQSLTPAAAEVPIDSGSQALFAIGLTLTGIVVTPFWYLATPVILPLSIVMGQISAVFGYDRWQSAFNFYALPLQAIFLGIKVLVDSLTPGATAAIPPAVSQDNPADSHESPAATYEPPIQGLQNVVEKRPRQRTTGNRVSTLPLRAAALSVPAPSSFLPNISRQNKSDAPTQAPASETKQTADLPATEQTAISNASGSGSRSAAGNNRAVRSR